MEEARQPPAVGLDKLMPWPLRIGRLRTSQPEQKMEANLTGWGHAWFECLGLGIYGMSPGMIIFAALFGLLKVYPIRYY